MTVSLSNVSGLMYELGESIRFGQAPSISPPLLSNFSREPNMPRNTGSPLTPPLRTAEKPGMVFR